VWRVTVGDAGDILLRVARLACCHMQKYTFERWPERKFLGVLGDLVSRGW